VAVVDLSAGSVERLIPVSTSFGFRDVVRITPDGTYALTWSDGATVVLELASGDTAATVGTVPSDEIALSFDGRFAVLAGATRLQLFDLQSLTLLTSFSRPAEAAVATSPSSYFVASLTDPLSFAELVYLDTFTAGGLSPQGSFPTGPPPEGDLPMQVVLTPDGLRAVVSNGLSKNLALVDLVRREVVRYLPAGLRVGEATITPDGRTAVALNGEEHTASVIDLELGEEVARLVVPFRPVRVAVSPDGGTAYVTAIAGQDRLYFVDLDGAASTVTGSLPVGQMGAANGYVFSEVSGIALSPDGSVLALCVSLDDEVWLVDTAAQSVVAQIPVDAGAFPVRVAFSSDGSSAYVANSAGDSLSVISIDGPASQVVATIPGIEFPLTVDPGPLDRFVYVGSHDFVTPALYVVDLLGPGVVAVLPLPGLPRASGLDPAGERLFLAVTYPGELVTVRTAGMGSSIVDATPLASIPRDLAFSRQTGAGVLTLPLLDEVVLFGDLHFGLFGDGFESGDLSAWSGSS
jgi:DNA-binding beta-propeller fold protein YncE